MNASPKQVGCPRSIKIQMHGLTCVAPPKQHQPTMNAYARKSKIALGFCLVSLLFLLETSLADHHMPNPASPIIWTLLGTTATACLAYAVWAHGKSKNSG